MGSEGVYDSGFYPSVKALLESDDCRGVVCHVRSTADSIPILFNNPQLGKKVFYIPFGIDPPVASKQPRQDDIVTILFTSSWNQGATGFYLRGGLDVVEAYVCLREKYRNLRLLLRCRLPVEIRERYRQLIEHGDIQVFDEFLSVEEMEALFCQADIYALPSARLHVVSILQAMAHGLALVVSDGWGINEYVDDGKTAMVVSGRYGICSWMDSGGMLRENYKPLFSVNPGVVHRLVDKLDQLIQSSSLRQELGEAARNEVDENFSVKNWNTGLAKLLIGR